MEIGVTLLTGDASSVVGLAELTNRVVPQSRRTDALYHVESGCVTELCFGMPQSAIDMDPVVIRSALQWLSGHDRSALLLLSGTIVLFGFFNKLFLQTFLLSFSVCFLLVRDLGRFEEIRFSGT